MSRASFKKVWRIPVILGVLTLFGLLAALLGTGFWYPIAWIAVAVPLIVISTKFLKKT